MANANVPSGFSPVKYLLGANWTGQANMYYIASNDSNAFYIGDPVKSSGDGDATRGIPGVTLGTAGAAMRGVIVGIGTNPDSGPYIDPSNLTLISAPATKTKAYYVLVADDPNIIFEIQEPNSGGTALASTDIGNNINFVYGAPATGVAVSGVTLDNTTTNTTSTLNCKLLGLVRRVDNAFGRSAKWLVLINNHELRGGTTGV